MADEPKTPDTPEKPGTPETREVPKSFREKVREHPWIYAGVALSFIIPLIVGTWLLIQSGSGFSEYPERDESREATSVSELVTSTAETSSAEMTDTADAGGDSDADASDGGDGDSEYAVAKKIAYRSGDTLFVAEEDGSAPVEVAASPRGAFALSPDGETLAWVNGETAKLNVATVGDSPIEVGPAEDVAPSWAPDSAQVVYVSADETGTAVRVVKRDGTGDRELARGHTPRASAGAELVTFIEAPGPGQVGNIVIVDFSGRQVGRFDGVKAVEAYATDEHVIYSVPGTKAGEEQIRIAELDGEHQSQLVGPAHLGLPVVFSGLTGSPDGKFLLYTASGDDGFSHLYVIEAEPDGTARSLKVRRDIYQLRWGADSETIFMVEGNAFQGEPTNVVSVSPEGLGRVVVVEGAGM